MLNSWTEGYSEIPKFHQLEEFVCRPLPNSLPHWEYEVSPPPVDNDVLSLSSAYSVDGVSQILVGIRLGILYPNVVGYGEQSWISVIDSLVVQPMVKVLAPHVDLILQSCRNAGDMGASSTAMESLRPDLLLWLPNGVLGFKGEEKALGLKTAQRELLDKCMNINPLVIGNLPYHLAYASGDGLLTFHAIEFESMSMQTIAGPFSLIGSCSNRANIVRCTVNCFKILRTMASILPYDPVLSLGKVMKNSYRSIMILSNGVSKRTSQFTPDVVKLYDQLLAKSISHLIYPTSVPKISRSGFLTICLEPLGTTQSPTCEKEQKQFLKHILTALQGLHHIGWVHRDIRMTNTIRTISNEWYLIDLEYANEVDKDLPPIKVEYMPPEHQASDESLKTSANVWGRSADIWQVGQLIKIIDSPEARYFKAALTHIDPSRRPTASDALRHAYLSEC